MRTFLTLLFTICLSGVAYSVRTPPAPFNPSKEKVAIMRVAVQRINQAVEQKLIEKNLNYNSGLNDFLFARRVYVDLTGTIPSYEELVTFVNRSVSNKRTYLINQLLASEGYVSHNYNYFADLLRIQTKMQGGKINSALFTGWLKDSIHQDKPYNRLVYEMVSASGSILENPATGYLLRDKDMKLDHVAFMTKIFLAKDIACAQCHDHPSEEWTQKEYYAFASYLGELEIGSGKNIKKSKKQKSMLAEKEKLTNHPTFRSAVRSKYKKFSVADKKTKELKAEFKDITSGNHPSAFDNAKSNLPLPEDYQYDDAKPGELLKPSFIVGRSLGGSTKKSKREQLAYWLAHPDNGWFSLAIANRMWARYMGRGVVEPLHDVKMKNCPNPALLKTLAEVMVALDFDLRAFSWVILHTNAYNRLASRKKIDEKEDYLFPGPILRRMSAEQIWDSLVTLMVKDPLRYRQPSPISLAEVNDGWSAFHFVDNLTDEKYRLVDSSTGNLVLTEGDDYTASYEQTLMTKKGKKSIILARASELPQPAPAGHFLQKFGQSERLFVVGASSKVGSVPQLMELMNGFPTEVLTGKDSLLFQKLQSIADPRKKAEVVFLSILNRKPTEDEKELLLQEMENSTSEELSDLIWALLNTPEFFFIK
ncbi:MAG: DUF1549 domain-containing protein [Opitutae bacterium]|jgi:hypothetical protein|nr:DUF1549 domain-containing protein [Opitutae bacterium]